MQILQFIGGLLQGLRFLRVLPRLLLPGVLLQLVLQLLDLL